MIRRVYSNPHYTFHFPENVPFRELIVPGKDNLQGHILVGFVEEKNAEKNIECFVSVFQLVTENDSARVAFWHELSATGGTFSDLLLSHYTEISNKTITTQKLKTMKKVTI
ncbi:MAG: hypothetical protein FD166_3141, partial [Bacteroidetes bacterium]